MKTFLAIQLNKNLVQHIKIETSLECESYEGSWSMQAQQSMINPFIQHSVNVLSNMSYMLGPVFETGNINLTKT